MKLLINGEIGYVQKNVTLNIGHTKTYFSEPPRYTTGSFQSHQQSTAENMSRFSSFPLLLFRKKQLSKQKNEVFE